MVQLLAGVIWLLLVASVLAIAARRLRAVKTLAPNGPLPDAPTVAVIVPARDEAAGIEGCLHDLLNQQFPTDRLQIAVVDDDSTDDTAALAGRLAETDPRLKVMEAGELPDGWTGKANACWRGARNTESAWLCFMDADVQSSPQLLSTAMAFAQKRNIDLLSLHPHIEMESFWEKVVLPVGHFAALLALDTSKVNLPGEPEAQASGGFMLVRRSVYEAVGGHGAVRAEILDDVALARVVKQRGHHIYWARGDELVGVRLYRGLHEMWAGLSKNAGDIISRRGVLGALVAAGGALLLGWFPFALVTWTLTMPGQFAAVAFALAAASIIGLATSQAYVAHTMGAPAGYGVLFPFGFTLAAAITVNSIRQRLGGRVMWRGREYRVR